MLKVGDTFVKDKKTYVYKGYGIWAESPSSTATSTIEGQQDILTELDKKADLTENQPVNVISTVLPTGAATEAKQLPDNHNVTVSNQISTTGLATSAKQDTLLIELEKKADLTETQPVSMSTAPLPTGGSTSALQTELNQLIQTLNELNSRLMVLAGMANSGAPALRTIPIASVSTAVTGSLTTLTTLTNFGTNYPATEVSHDINNFTAIVANINNVAVSP